MTVGWKLWQKAAPWGRDFFLPVPTKTLDRWENYECKYAEVTVLSQVLESELSVNGEKLLCQGVPGRLWREHSPRAFLPSCTGGLRYPKNWQDAIGGWSPGQSQAYVRTKRKRLSIMQSTVAKLLRDGRGDKLGERDLEEDLLAHLTRPGFSADLVREKASKCREPGSSLQKPRTNGMKKRWQIKKRGR